MVVALIRDPARTGRRKRTAEVKQDRKAAFELIKQRMPSFYPHSVLVDSRGVSTVLTGHVEAVWHFWALPNRKSEKDLDEDRNLSA